MSTVGDGAAGKGRAIEGAACGAPASCDGVEARPAARGSAFVFASARQGQEAPATATADDRAQAFRAVSGGNDLQSGEKLLVEAYALMWIILMAFVLLGWRRQKGIDERIAALEAAVARARAAGGAHGAERASEGSG